MTRGASGEQPPRGRERLRPSPWGRARVWGGGGRGCVLSAAAASTPVPRARGVTSGEEAVFGLYRVPVAVARKAGTVGTPRNPTCISARTHTCSLTFSEAYTYTHVHTYRHTCAHICTSAVHPHTHAHKRAVHAHMCSHVHTCAHPCTCMHTRTWTHAHIHTDAHACAHTQRAQHGGVPGERSMTCVRCPRQQQPPQR